MNTDPSLRVTRTVSSSADLNTITYTLTNVGKAPITFDLQLPGMPKGKRTVPVGYALNISQAVKVSFGATS